MERQIQVGGAWRPGRGPIASHARDLTVACAVRDWFRWFTWEMEGSVKISWQILQFYSCFLISPFQIFIIFKFEMRIEFDEILINFSSRESKLAQELLQILCEWEYLRIRQFLSLSSFHLLFREFLKILGSLWVNCKWIKSWSRQERIRGGSSHGRNEIF